MGDKTRAWMLSEDYESRSEIYFLASKTLAEAEEEIGEYEWEEWSDATRKPDYDKYAPGPVPAEVLLKDGWWWECGHCSHRCGAEPCESCIDEGVLGPSDESPVFHNDWAFCGAHCRDAEERRRAEKMQKADAERLVEDFNAANPVGTDVVLTDDFGNEHQTKTKSPAWLLGGGQPLVGVEGRAGGYLLTRIRPAKQGEG